MTPDREKLIRAAWSRVRPQAMKMFESTAPHFDTVLEEPRSSWDWGPGVMPETFTSERITFVHMMDSSGTLNLMAAIGGELFRRDMTGQPMGLEGAVKITDAYEEPIPFRVVCEGVIVEEGEYPVRMRR